MQGINLKNYAAHSLDPTPNNLDDDKTVMHSNCTKDAKNVGSDDEQGQATVCTTDPATKMPKEFFCAGNCVDGATF